MKRQGLEDEDLSDKMRLDKLLALLGEGTRSEIKAMVRAGRVTVDGRAAKDAGMQVCGEMDDIRLDGRALYYKAVRHVMLNKPSGVLTAARDKKQKTVMDLLPPMYAAMGAMPAGRLDKDTEGLLVITSDGQLAHRIISPKHEVGKVYYARLDGELTDEDVAALEAGIHIRDADGEFDAVITNPPIRAGKAVIYQMFADAKAHLADGGILVLVIRKQQGAPSALKYLKELYAEAETIERDGGYWVIACRK